VQPRRYTLTPTGPGAYRLAVSNPAYYSVFNRGHFFPRDKGMEHEADHLSHLVPKLRRGGAIHSAYIFMACIGTTLPVLHILHCNSDYITYFIIYIYIYIYIYEENV
jgi:hypothetical protein